MFQIYIVATKQFMILAKSNLELIKWARACQMPNFDEYMEAEVGAYAAMTCSIIWLGDIGKKEDFEGLRSSPKFVNSLATKTRLIDDINDYEVLELILKMFTKCFKG